MRSMKSLLNKLTLLKEDQLSNFIENKTTFGLQNCEFNIYETHSNTSNFKLSFDHLAFTGMLQGKKRMKLEGKTDYFEYLPGESVLVAPGETMVIDFPEASESPSQCISLSFNPEFVESSLNELNLNAPKIDHASNWNISLNEFYLFNTPSLAMATNNIMRIAMEDNPQKDVIANFALKELLIRLMQTQGRNLVEKSILKSKSHISFVVEHIRKNLHQKLTIDQIADMTYLSKSNFFKMFKQEFGISPNRFILNERIKKAKELLAKDESIKEVAFQTGFSDTNYFTRVFRQYEGTTPKIFQSNVLSL
ncbi:AraC family transcriptional regulator [Elizabethkingia meningoseptica]|nr:MULTISPECIES: AraC family transcriptional regulator [Elizabethkingia]AQX47159.1 AraC family transcriptional regulator [Elizabethkingia meningoseptica]EJK5329367.1 AraC family transcriptional regulator [Elizabethkingia meningoseptica]EOR30537.1 AraC family transcriptional regulator [Elizabethkingia meningoseptica ATCC 13253 = NBRC 12535]KUY17866.1 AraC family transcriptional regulator [Elizabethkingia meningoseptica]MBG0514191.1 AraC family transcriptional regulator [Elizabethkingia meningos